MIRRSTTTPTGTTEILPIEPLYRFSIFFKDFLYFKEEKTMKYFYRILQQYVEILFHL